MSSGGTGLLACRLAAASLLALQALAQETMVLADGQLVIGWISTSSFHFCRAWGDQKCAPRAPAVRADVKVEREDTASRVRLSTEYVVVEVDREDGRLRVLDNKGKELMSEAEAVARVGAEISVERVAPPGEAYYGLGARADPQADGRGLVIESTRPFLVSSAGYGLHHDGPGNYRFDLAGSKSDRYHITVRPAQRFEYYFYYGPVFKSVLEEHRLVVTPRVSASLGILSRADLPEGVTLAPSPVEGSWESLGDAIRSLVHASLSGVLSPGLDLGPYRNGSVALYRRAAQLASISPLVCDTSSGPLVGERAKARYELAEWRRRLVPFLTAYVDEAGYRGFPVLHPLPFQYPNDKEAGRFADEFMVGDELLAAPVYTESSRRSVYFPMGNWTDLRTNRLYSGRQRVEVEAAPDVMSLFLRNGSILPLESEAAGGPMELHYTPKLAAEFFLYESDISRYSQLHASPALDLMRLEIDSRKTRAYEWIVHHLPAPREVKTGEAVYREVKERRRLQSGAWYYDRERGNLHVVVYAFAGQVQVTYIAF